MRTSVIAAAVFMAGLMLFSDVLGADDLESRLDRLAAEVAHQAEIIQAQQKTIESLKEELARQKPQPQPKEASAPGTKVSSFFGGSVMTNPNISAVLDTYAYASNLKDSQLDKQGIPGFTTQGLEQRNGFNVREVELFLFAPVDPYFNLYINLPVNEDGIELEEAYAVTTFLPEGFQSKVGKFKSNFSRLDAQHPHAWDFFDIALPYRAFMGAEGLGGEKGIQLTWLPDLPIYTQFGAEVLQGDNDLLFGSDASNNPHAFTLFAKSSVDTTDNSTLYFGPSVLFGKTKNNNIVEDAEFDGDSILYDLEAVWKWKPTSRNGLTLQSEYLFLDQHGDLTDSETAEVDPLRRRQDGFYLQGRYYWNRWALGARYDMLELFADRFRQAGEQQDFGPTPWRVTGALEFNPSEFSRIRLQCSHDESARNGPTNNEAILQFLFGIGAHAAHSF